jgi:uridine kinase
MLLRTSMATFACGVARSIRARLGPGDHFGELAILGAPRRTATAYTETPVRLAAICRGRASSRSRRVTHASRSMSPRRWPHRSPQTIAAMTVRRRLAPASANTAASLGRRVMVSGVARRRRDGGAGDHAAASFRGRSARVAACSIIVRFLSRRPSRRMRTSSRSPSRAGKTTNLSCKRRSLAARSCAQGAPAARISLGPRRGEAQRVLWPADAIHVESVAAVGQKCAIWRRPATPLREELWSVDEARARLTEQGWNEARRSSVPQRQDDLARLLRQHLRARASGP